MIFMGKMHLSLVIMMAGEFIVSPFQAKPLQMLQFGLSSLQYKFFWHAGDRYMRRSSEIGRRLCENCHSWRKSPRARADSDDALV